MPIKNVTETDVIDMVKRLRTHINALDNIHWLASKLEYIQDEAVQKSILNTMSAADSSANVAAELLRDIENSDTYRDILLKYTTELTHRMEHRLGRNQKV
jgi:cell fate (sporulation/competence/biofilm development) regulator YmcA (YheA/YmcA/DUF963 family)